MTTHVNIYEMTIDQIEEIKRGDIITQGEFLGIVIDIDAVWDLQGGYFKFSTKKGEKTFRIDFNRDLTPGVTHKHFKEMFDNNSFLNSK